MKKWYLCGMIVWGVVFLCSGAAPAQEDESRVYTDFGIFAYEDGAYEDALENFKKALAIDPGNPDASYFLGKTLAQLDRLEEAEFHLNKARQLDADIPGLTYELALLYYKTERYDRSARLFQEVAEEAPTNVLAIYYAGISLYKLKRYDDALPFFLDASEKSPTIKANGYYYAGICYLQTGDFTQAIEKFAYVEANATSLALKENAARWLAASRQRARTQKPYALYFKLGYQYDSNILLEPIDEDLPTDESDTAIVGFLSGRYNFINRDRLKVGAGYSHYQIAYSDLREFDFIGSLGSLYARYGVGDVTYGFTYAPNYYWLDREDYLASHQLRPDLTWRVNDTLTTRLAYTYVAKNYFQTDARDGHANLGDLDVFLSFLDRKLKIFGGGGFEANQADSPNQSYNTAKFRAGLYALLPLEFRFRLSGTLTKKDYKYVNTIFGVRREDVKWDMFAALSRKLIWNWLEVVGDYRFTRNDSNIKDSSNVEVFDYDRNQFTLSLAASF